MVTIFVHTTDILALKIRTIFSTMETQLIGVGNQGDFQSSDFSHDGFHFDDGPGDDVEERTRWGQLS